MRGKPVVLDSDSMLNVYVEVGDFTLMGLIAGAIYASNDLGPKHAATVAFDILEAVEAEQEYRARPSQVAPALDPHHYPAVLQKLRDAIIILDGFPVASPWAAEAKVLIAQAEGRKDG